MTDSLQAIVAALLFGEDAGLAAMEDTTALYPGGGCVVRLSDGARELLAEAWSIAEGYRPTMGRGGIARYDLRGGDRVNAAEVPCA